MVGVIDTDLGWWGLSESIMGFLIGNDISYISNRRRTRPGDSGELLDEYCSHDSEFE